MLGVCLTDIVLSSCLVGILANTPIYGVKRSGLVLLQKNQIFRIAELIDL